MKKCKKLPIIIILICAIIIGAISYFLYFERPFETISINEIEEVKVYAVPPDGEVVLSKEQVESIVPLLQNLKVCNPGYEVLVMGGQTVSIKVRKTDGLTMEIVNNGNIQIIIDGKAYKADYATAEAINQFANKVLETGF